MGGLRESHYKRTSSGFCRLLLAAGTLAGQPDLASAMEHLHVRTALVVPSQAIDEQPVWSPDGKRLAVKIEDTWRVTEIDNARLGEGTSHGHERIGADREPSLSPIALAVVNDRMKSVVRGSRRVRTSGGLIVELRQVEQGTRFVVTPRGGTAKILWSTGLE